MVESGRGDRPQFFHRSPPTKSQRAGRRARRVLPDPRATSIGNLCSQTAIPIGRAATSATTCGETMWLSESLHFSAHHHGRKWNSCHQYRPKLRMGYRQGPRDRTGPRRLRYQGPQPGRYRLRTIGDGARRTLRRYLSGAGRRRFPLGSAPCALADLAGKIAPAPSVAAANCCSASFRRSRP
jgi:hypothetical protein